MSAWWVRLCFALVLISGALEFRSFTASTNSRPKSDTQQPALTPTESADFQLIPGKPFERDLKSGEKHTYPLRLKANDYLKLVAEQKGIDVVVRLIGSDGKILKEVDSPNGTQGPEPLSSIVEQSGGYIFEVESLEKTAPPGKYELKLEAVKPATEQDRAQVDVEKLNAEAEKLWRAGKYRQALPLAQQALEKSEKIFGPEHLLVAVSLNNLAVPCYFIGDYAKAEPLYQRALAIKEKTLGSDHADVATSLNNLAALHRARGNFVQAESLYQQALAIYEKALGPRHPAAALSLDNLATLYLDKGNYAQAELLYQRALAIREEALGPDHPDTAQNLNNLATLYQITGSYAKAGLLYQRALAIREKALGPDHPDTAQSLNNLATLYQIIGSYAKAEPLHQRALAIRRKVLGPDHPLVASSLRNLSSLYQIKGDYAQAEPLSKLSLAIREKTLGLDHPDIALSLNNLAGLYLDKGDVAQAEPVYQRALAIREKALGPDHPNTAESLNNLAYLYQGKGDYAQAELLFQRALAIWEKAFGSDHPFFATILNNLANLYESKGDYLKAGPLYQRALALRKKGFGPDHPDVANSLINLGGFYRDQGDYARAEPLYKDSLTIYEQTLGRDHPLVANNLKHLAVLSLAKRETAQAVQYQAQSNDITERDLIRNLATGSEHQKALYLKTTGDMTDLSISLHVREAPQDRAALRAALTVILRRKGRALDAMTGAIETLRRQQTPEIQKLLDDHAALAGQISVLTLRGPGTRKPAEHLAYLKELEQQKEKLEIEISAKSAEFKVQVTPITLENVQQQIPVQASLVEYAVYRPYDTKTCKLGTPRYVAYVLKSSKSKTEAVPDPDIQFADLGEAEPIERAVAVLRKTLSNPKADLDREVKPAAQALDRLVMKPVRALVGGTKHLLLSPDGALNLIPFAALVDEQGRFLVETYTLTYLTSGRDLLRLQVKIPHQEPALVLADPDYQEGKGPLLIGKQYAPLARLKGTAQEGTALEQLLPGSRLKMQLEATKEELKATHRPEILHLATHGYFLADVPRATSDTGNRTLGRMEETARANVDQLRVENPLLRSWLFFTGANQGGTANEGTMTALEAAQLDLWGTKLVTLSACETGVGEAKTGEGVYGLRRALVLAGSEAQMMSLWSISDQGTRELMVDYYTRLKAGEGRSEALRNVQLRLLKHPKFRHPYFWASFIQSGEWRNLAGQ